MEIKSRLMCKIDLNGRGCFNSMGNIWVFFPFASSVVYPDRSCREGSRVSLPLRTGSVYMHASLVLVWPAREVSLVPPATNR